MALIGTVVWAAIVGGLNLKLGFGLWFDLLFAFTIAALGIPIAMLAVALILKIARKLPAWIPGFFVGVVLFCSLLWFGSLGWTMGVLLVLLEGTMGAAVTTVLSSRFRSSSRKKQAIAVTLCVLTIAGNAWLFAFLHSDGINEELIQMVQNKAHLPPMLASENPADSGPYGVRKLFYGSGNDLRRPEYRNSIAIRTPTVDAAPFFKDFTGWKAKVRRRYWGFGMDKLPLNARVWYPEGLGPFPLVLIVHGNHDMAEFSDAGYRYLGELLASRGFILASIDENFLNSGLFHDPPKQQAVRGWMLLEYLKLWRQWNEDRRNPFYHRVDLENVALMGHSRGGEAAATAALFNKLAYYPDDATIRFQYGFPIKSVVAIAPADGQYKPAGQWRVLKDINYFTIQGANDADVSSFMGSRQWDHVQFSGAGSFFKSELYIYRANHGQFNTVWGRTDFGAPTNWFLNLRPLLKGDEQRRIARVYLSAFLETTLHDRREYLPLFADYRTGRDWLPNTLYENRYLDSASRVVSNFNEDADVTTTTVPGGHISAEHLTVWREGRIPYRHDNRDYNGVFIGWNREHPKGKSEPPVASYSVDLPSGLAHDWNLNARSALALSIAVTDENAPPPGKKSAEKDASKKQQKQKPEWTDFSIELTTGDGITSRLPLSNFRGLLPPLKVQFTKVAYLDGKMYEKASEPIFQTVAMPLSAFATQNTNFDPSKLKAIRLKFDRTQSRVIILSEIAFEQPLP
ncbi:MAG: hypothetical protein JO138_02705 [Acidobacteriaceae bacterium]|nr:hypothetical protein [Acidobacteriaceae bacterium]